MDAPSILVLGSGNAFHDDGRGSACVWIEPVGAAPFLVDVGPTAVRSMIRSALDCQRLDRLFLTHLHGDHTAGWPFLLLHLVMRGRRERAFDVFGPVGTRDVLENLARLSYRDILTRQVFEIRYHELAVARRRGLDAGGLSFETWPMRHHESSIGLLFHLEGCRVGISGDTSWCPELEQLAASSDLLLLECSSSGERIVGHLSLEELRSARDRLGSCPILLVHLDDAVAEALARDPLPGVIAAHDGMSWGPGSATRPARP